MPATKGQKYSTKKYLSEGELKTFQEFIKEANVSVPELAAFDDVEPKTIYVRFANKRVEKKFAKAFMNAKKEALDKKFKNWSL